MKNSTLFLLSIFFIGTTVFAQEKKIKQGLQGHTNQNKFKQLKDQLATPNSQRTA